MSIPKLDMYSPTEDRMNLKQRQFYGEAEKKLLKGEYVEVGNNIGYVFTYLYKVLARYEKYGAHSVYDNLMHISEMYSQQDKIKKYCIFWAGECLLAARKYERYINESISNLQQKGSYFPNLRLNLQMILGRDEGWELDLIKLFVAHSSSFTKKNEAIYHDYLIEATRAYVQERGGFKNFFNWLINDTKPGIAYLFGGSPIPKLEMPDLIFTLWSRADELKKPLQLICRDAENQARTHLGLPAIGEGWISETELFRALAARFSQTQVLQHGHPQFLGRQHYDVWFPHWKVAVEFHGQQHFEAVAFFGGDEAFQRTRERDQRKIQLSKENGVHLFIVSHGYDLSMLINQIASTRDGKDYSL